MSPQEEQLGCTGRLGTDLDIMLAHKHAGFNQIACLFGGLSGATDRRFIFFSSALKTFLVSAEVLTVFTYGRFILTGFLEEEDDLCGRENLPYSSHPLTVLWKS